VTFVVIRSGEAELNKWLTETRNVLEDYRRIYGEAAKADIGAVSISINSQNTGTSAESFFGAISFKRKRDALSARGSPRRWAYAPSC
jgi:Protein of unknown function (DUF3047)